MRTALLAIALTTLATSAVAAEWKVPCPTGNAAIVEWAPDRTGDGSLLLNIGTPQIKKVDCKDESGKVIHTIRGLPEVQLDSGEQVNAFLKRAQNMLVPRQQAKRN